jgi:hypothetical protein
VAWAVRFDEPAYSGASVLCGPDQIVFLHGPTLARHDWKHKKEIWSANLVDKKQIEAEVEKEIKDLQEYNTELANKHPDADAMKIPSRDKLLKSAAKAAAYALSLHVVGSNVWVQSPGKLTRYDWDTGKSAKEIVLGDRYGGLMPRGDELLWLNETPDKKTITHINLATGETREEFVAKPAKPAVADKGKSPKDLASKAADVSLARAQASKNKGGAGLPVGVPGGRDSGRPLDPRKVEEQANELSLPARIALPAALSANRTQQRTLDEMNGGPADLDDEFQAANYFQLIPSKDGAVEFRSRLIEERLVAREAMKAPPKKSALEGAPTVANTLDIANEILNDMQRDRGGSKVTEDESRYQVTIRKPDATNAAWSGEVIGPPSVHPCKTVNVIAANKMVIVLDKENRRLWQGTLTYNVERGHRGDDETTGLGPIVERDNSLYVADQGVLTAFDLKTGNPRWRLPSVGVDGMFFDDAGMLYLNTTTASPDSLKYSKQIDISNKTLGVIMKIDPRTGKTLWSHETAGMISYMSGKFIYSITSSRPPNYDDEGESPYTVQTGFETPPFIRIKRINPKTGKELWVHFQERAPLDVKFDKTTIHLVFKKEVQVLKFLSL